MPQAFNTDFCIYQNGSLVGFVAVSKVAEHWMQENVMADCALWVERHHAGDLLDVLCREGLHVSVGMTGGTRTARLLSWPQVARAQPHR
jgi:hypothetical protein